MNIVPPNFWTLISPHNGGVNFYKLYFNGLYQPIRCRLTLTKTLSGEHGNLLTSCLSPYECNIHLYVCLDLTHTLICIDTTNTT